MTELRGIYTVWLRELIRFGRDRPRRIASLIPPVLFLFVLGTGVATTFKRFSYLPFVFPGIIGMSVLFTSIFAGASVVWDREFGFLKEVLVAPVSRWAVAVGRALGGSTGAVLQASAFLLIAPIVGVKLTLTSVLLAILFIFALSFSITAFGIALAARMSTTEGFMMVTRLFTTPVFLLSGALFDMSSFPPWLGFLAALNPFAYGVDALRFIISGIHARPVSLDIAVVLLFGLASIAIAAWMFQHTE